MRRRSNDNYSDGSDSFLDIVANLVGILIILVVVVGANAAHSWQNNDEVAEDYQQKIDKLHSETIQRTNHAASLETENHELVQKTRNERIINSQLRDQRDLLLTKLEVVHRELDRLQTTEMDQLEREQWKAAEESEKLRLKIEKVKMRCNAISGTIVDNRQTITHYPTPIAKTVFADEVHFRLAGGRLAYVPMDELVAAMRSEWRVKAQKLKTIEKTMETVGPIGMFRLQYELETDTENTQRALRRVAIKFRRFVIRPIRENVGEPIDVALSNGSKFDLILQRKDPRKTTVSVWVYPDSFEAFERLKDFLRKRGIQTAGWPLTKGKDISGGPNGFRTTAN